MKPFLPIFANIKILCINLENSVTRCRIDIPNSKTCCFSPSKKFWYIFLFFVINFQAIAQTAIVIFRGTDAIVIGTDSKFLVTATKSSESHQFVMYDCKIIQIENLPLVYAIAGHPTMQSIKFSIPIIINSVFAKSKNVSENIAEIDSILIDEMNKKIPSKIADTIYNQIVFAGIENNIRKFWIRDYRNRATTKRKVNFIITQKYVCPGDCIEKELFQTGLGEHSIIDSVFAGEGQWDMLKKYGIQGTIEKLITAQAIADTSHVGGAIDIIKITANGLEWIKKQKKCAAIRH